MFEKYLAEFYVTEQELEEIHSTLTTLNTIEPEVWTLDLLEHANPNKPSQEILLNLTNSIPELAAIKWNLSKLGVIESLRFSAIALNMLLQGKDLDYLFVKQLYMMYSNFFLGLRYLIASEILSAKLKKELNFDPVQISSILTQSTSDTDDLFNKVVAAKAAREEIERLYTDDVAKQYVQHISEFEAAIEKYIKDNFVSVLIESFMRVMTEAIVKNAEIIDNKIQLEEGFSPYIKYLAEGIFKTAQQSTNRRLGRTRGGKRERKGFNWTNGRKIAFYHQVESLPKIKNQSCWEFALDELVEQEFDAETVSWLKSHPAFRALPDSVFSDAVRVWRKHFDLENWKERKRNERPRYFEFRHALYLLDYPDEFAFSTLEIHYYKGKKLASDAQDQT